MIDYIRAALAHGLLCKATQSHEWLCKPRFARNYWLQGCPHCTQRIHNHCTLCSIDASTRYGSHGPSLHDDTDNPNYSKLSLGTDTTTGRPLSSRPLPNPHTQGSSNHRPSSLYECTTPPPSTYAVVSPASQLKEQADTTSWEDAANLYETISNLDLELEKEEAQPYAEPVVTKINS